MQLDRLTPVEAAVRRQRRIRSVVLLIGLLGLAYYFVFGVTYVMAYNDDREHFKYGSIGSETASGIPYWVFRALPKLYEDQLGPQGYRRFGLLYEPGRDLPIGFSRRVVDGVERVWLNCAVCHVGTVEGVERSDRQMLYGAPANNLRLFEFISFLRRVPIDSRFTPDRLIEAINSPEVGGDLGPIARAFYRYVVFDRVKGALLDIRSQLAFMDRQHDWGPGRVDTFNPYKAIQFNFPMTPAHISDVELNGSSDYPSIWRQGPRQGMQLHWDGNNSSVDERNLSAALGAGVTPVTVDHSSIRRVREWLLQLPAPRYELTGYDIDWTKADRGRETFAVYCASCHGMGLRKEERDVAAAAPSSPNSRGPQPLLPSRTVERSFEVSYDYNTRRYPRLGKVQPLASIGTDRGRWASYTEAFAAAQNLLYAGYPQRFKEFRKTAGYSNQPLDGIWARSPYLHNGSVPTLRDLLEPAALRPVVWYRGSERFDPVRVGYAFDGLGESKDSLFRYDARVLGNANSGHEGRRYGTLLSDAEKDDLVEFMKTL